MRHHANLGATDLRVGPDPIDERGASRRGREQPLQDDQAGPVLENRLKRLNGFGVGERQELALFGQAPTQSRHQVGRGYYHRCGHRCSLTCRPFLSGTRAAAGFGARP